MVAIKIWLRSGLGLGPRRSRWAHSAPIITLSANTATRTSPEKLGARSRRMFRAGHGGDDNSGGN
eukprot:336224-Alexandrium_andersonii.AAC.1